MAFAEMAPGQAEAIKAARFVANVGCYATGSIALLRPLIDAKMLPADAAVAINAVSGYSGGGKALIADHESGAAPAFKLYALGLAHKHVPEIMAYSGLTRRPIFVPSVGNFAQGMLVSIPLFLDQLPSRPSVADLGIALAAHYGRIGVRPRRRRERGFADRAGVAQRQRRHGTPRLRQPGGAPSGARRQARQPRQGSLGCGRAEHGADVRPCDGRGASAL